jgi:hypothetical protein
MELCPDERGSLGMTEACAKTDGISSHGLNLLVSLLLQLSFPLALSLTLLFFLSRGSFFASGLLCVLWLIGPAL